MSTKKQTLLSWKPALAALVVAALTAGCSAMPGRPPGTALMKRDEPSVVLCTSERTADGGIRLIGRLETGKYPISGAEIEYRTAEASDPPPVTTSGREFELSGATKRKGEFSKSEPVVTFTIAPDAARRLGDKVVWYRWTVLYGSGSARTAVHRTSVAEAGLPRAANEPGPDSSVAPGTARGR